MIDSGTFDGGQSIVPQEGLQNQWQAHSWSPCLPTAAVRSESVLPSTRPPGFRPHRHWQSQWHPDHTVLVSATRPNLAAHGVRNPANQPMPAGAAYLTPDGFRDYLMAPPGRSGGSAASGADAEAKEVYEF